MVIARSISMFSAFQMCYSQSSYTPPHQRSKHPRRARILGVPDVLIADSEFEIWDGKSVIPSADESKECFWGKYIIQNQFVDICLHSLENDRYISQRIVDSGRWNECDLLVDMLHGMSEVIPTYDRLQVFVDVGANIGACVLQASMKKLAIKIFDYCEMRFNCTKLNYYLNFIF